MQEAVAGEDRQKITEEIGDLLFMTVNLSRFLDIHPEDALERSLVKFSARFRNMEVMADKDGRSLEEMPLEEMEEYWQEAKKNEKP